MIQDIYRVQRLALEIAREYQWTALDRGRSLMLHQDVHLALLCDLTRPASRDAIARLIGETLGHTGPTAPTLVYTPARPPDSVACWELLASGGTLTLLHYPPDIEATLGPPPDPTRHQIHVRDLPGDPAGALEAMARVALRGAP